MSQEHWLSEQQLPLLEQLGVQYVARSGMEEEISSGILRGRPFGGVGIAWSPQLNHLITPLSNSRHKRVVGIELEGGDSKYLFLSIYMPFYDSSNREKCMSETVETIAMIETILDEHPTHLVCIGGDFNTELKGNSPFDPMWSELMLKYSFACCDRFQSPAAFTYHHETLGHKKFNDHFIVSKSVLEGNIAIDHNILDDGDNLSDHLPITMTISIPLRQGSINQNPPTVQPTLKWDKLSPDDLVQYTNRLCRGVSAVPLPSAVMSCRRKCGCRSEACFKSMQIEYDNITGAILKASASLPRQKPGMEKDWWTSELTEIRNKSIEINNLWASQGCPRHGPTHAERLRVRADYKRALRAAKRAPKQAAWDRMHNALVENKTDSFWKNWRRLYSKNKSTLAPVVNGCTTEEEITSTFKTAFQNNSKPNNEERVESLNKKFEEKYEAFCRSHEEDCNCNPFSISLSNVMDAICGMKSGKSADEEGISAEHLHHAPLNLFIRLTCLFNFMLNHSFVPKQFRFGCLIPIIKDNQGNKSDTNNYRGITISPIPSKLFEHCLKIVFCDYLTTSPHQYGFKKKSSTVHALYCLRETVSYYVNNGSRVFCSFLDASKAFDRLVHSGLFLKLIERNVPKAFLDVIISWYDGLLCRVRWGTHYSEWFHIYAGVRQGGVLSPEFYSIYVDDLIHELKARGIGCYTRGIFAAALFYADDMAILSPSLKGLQALLNICNKYCHDWDICLNPSKTKNLYFGKRCKNLAELSLNDCPMKWFDTCLYLGVTLKSGKHFGCSISDRIRKFYRCTNAILRIDGRSNEFTMLSLLESHCVPILTYAIEIVFVSDPKERRKLRVAYNSIFRSLFSYRYRDSVRKLQGFLGRPTWEALIDQKRSSFLARARQCPSNALIRSLL